MFKYISEIISKISMKQRLSALAIVLLAIVTISVAPKIVSSFTQDNEELELKVERQRLQIEQLSNQVDTLNQKVLSEQSTCTNRFVAREKEILDLLLSLETEARNSNGKILSTTTTMERREQRPRYVEESNDPNEPKVARMEMPSPPVEKTVVVKTDNSKLLKMISNVKGNVQNHIGQ
jgi:sensor c-di-GMP phosphodiesterase-like protein